MSSVLSLRIRNDWKLGLKITKNRDFWHISKNLQPIQTDDGNSSGGGGGSKMSQTEIFGIFELSNLHS